jgi:hypothetical protein
LAYDTHRPHRREIHYFLPRESGYATLFVIGEETSVPLHREAIDTFLNQIRVK